METDTSSLGFLAQFYIDFGGDCGLAEEFRDSKYYDMYPDTWGLRGPTNQPGHFLTAVAMAYRGVGLAEILFWPRPSPERQVSIDERIALGLIVGHEKVSDPSSNPYYTAQLQYWSADEPDVTLFLSAIGVDEKGDKTTRKVSALYLITQDGINTTRLTHGEDESINTFSWLPPSLAKAP